MFREVLLTSRTLAHALFLCVAVVSTTGPLRAVADSNTWADASDVAQYVPLAWAAVRTLHAEDAEGGFQLAAAGIATLGFSELIKRAINEKRPNYRPGGGRNSFPSGHVSKAWFAAAHLQSRYGCYMLEARCWRGSAVPYLAAVATAIGRVRDDRHHVSEVIGSAVLAEAWVRLTTDRFNAGLRIEPSLENGFGIRIFKEF